MVQVADGMNYAPEGQAEAVVGPGEFRFAALALDHGHIYGMSNGLIEAGAELVKVYDPDPEKVEAFRAKYPQAVAASSKQEILDDPSIQLVASAAVPCDRGPLGCEVMKHGKDYFTDKTPFTSLEQLAEAKRVVA
ncbi:MAG: putative dehydrogenase, partial [Rhodothermales bacterium]